MLLLLFPLKSLSDCENGILNPKYHASLKLSCINLCVARWPINIYIFALFINYLYFSKFYCIYDNLAINYSCVNFVLYISSFNLFTIYFSRFYNAFSRIYIIYYIG